MPRIGHPDDPDSAMRARQQMLGRKCAPLDIICSHVVPVRPGPRHHDNGDAGGARGRQVIEAAGRGAGDDAADPELPELFDVETLLCFLASRLSDNGQEAAGGGDRFDPAHHGDEEGISEFGDHHADRGRPILHEPPRKEIRRIAELGLCRLDPIARGVRHERMGIERPRGGDDGHARPARDRRQGCFRSV